MRGQVFILFVVLVIVKGDVAFLKDSYSGAIHQDASPGTSILKVKARDSQTTEAISYYVGLLDDKFEVGEHSGILVNTVQVTESINTSYTLPIIATSLGKVNITYVSVKVVKYNKFSPRFSNREYEADVYREVEVNAVILKLTAKDTDGQEKLSYIIENSANSDVIKVKEDTGELYVAARLPRKKKVYRLEISVFDGGSPLRHDKAKVAVYVRDLQSTSKPEAIEITKTSAYVCWKPAKEAGITEYVLTYWRYGWEGYVYNVTITAPKGVRKENVCHNLTSLLPWKRYHVHITAFKKDDRSPKSDSLVFKTRLDGCMYHPCESGTCQSIDDHPGYRCHCGPDYYGYRCQYFNICKMNPCQNNGLCRADETGGYSCGCSLGFYGKNCTLFNPCVKNPCKNHASCFNTSNNNYFCSCHPGYYGSSCEHLNPCHFSPCRNGATCYNTSSTTYGCACPYGYYGTMCQKIHPCAFRPCSNNGSCIQQDGPNFSCLCPLGFEGVHCEAYNHCLTHPCLNGGTCFHLDCTESISCRKDDQTCLRHCKGSVKYVFGCHCPKGLAGPTCANTTGCMEEITSDDSGDIFWPRTHHSTVAKIHCPFGPNSADDSGLAYRRCSLSPDGRAVWEQTSTSECVHSAVFKASKLVSQLTEMTVDPKEVTSSMIISIVDNLLRVVDQARQDSKITQKLLSVLSNLMSANVSVLIDSQKKTNAPARLLDILERCLTVTDMDGAPQMSFSSPSITAFVIETSPELLIQNNSISFRPSRDGSIEIKIPKEILPSGVGRTRVQFAMLENSKFFISEDTEMEDYQRLRSQNVLMASVRNSNEGVPSNNPVTYTITDYQAPGNYACVFWDVRRSYWSTEGLETVSRGENTTKCISRHLTSFSVLLDPTPWERISKSDVETLTFISYVGCGVSILGLLLTLLTYFLFGCLRCDNSGKILINLCGAMLFLNVAFVLGAHRDDLVFGEICITVSVLIHYFLLCTMMWMCVEAFNMHRMLITVFKSYEEKFILKRCVIAWGLPMVIVGIALAVDIANYDTKDEDLLCLMTPKNPWVYYFTFLAPCCLIILINAVVFVMVSRVIMKPKLQGRIGTNVAAISIAQVRGAATVMVLLGITWVFGMFAFGKAKTIFQYIFCVTNSLQGFFIFVVRCLMHPDARASWVLLLKEGTIKRKKGVSKSLSESSSRHESGNGRSDRSSSYCSKKISTTSLVSPAHNKSFWPTHKASSRSLERIRNQSSKKIHPPSLQKITYDEIQQERALIVTTNNSSHYGDKLLISAKHSVTGAYV